VSDNYKKSFDELLDAILTDWRNQFPAADTSQGSLIYIKSAVMASLLWGLYNYLEWISKQIFPDTADTEYLEHHAWVRGLTRTYGETDAAYLSRLLEYIRRPPAGGNRYDYIKWALSIDNVAAAYCYPLAQGLGTVDVIVVANEATTGSEIPSSYEQLSGVVTAVAEGKLIDGDAAFIASGVMPGDVVSNSVGNETSVVSVDSETQLSLTDDIFLATPDAYTVTSLIERVKRYIDDVRPVTASVVRVLGPDIVTQEVALSVTGDEANTTQTALDIEAYMMSLTPGQTLYVARLVSIAIANGADNATVSVPASDVTPAGYEMVRPGVIDVT
jgi:hypothetical protein